MTPESFPLDRRANVVAGAVVATVVLLVGFGSGIGAVVTRQRASSASPAAAATTSAPAVQAGAVGGAAPKVAGRMRGVAGTASVAAPGAAAAAPITPGRRTSSTARAVAAPSPASACSGQLVVDAMAEPFLTHLGAAHLEESPGEQAADVLDLDQYVKTHTVLVEGMAGPAFDVGVASLDGLDPFMAHLGTAHLGESPGEQAADVLALDEYVKTHTVLVGSMAAPAADAATTAGC